MVRHVRRNIDYLNEAKQNDESYFNIPQNPRCSLDVCLPTRESKEEKKEEEEETNTNTSKYISNERDLKTNKEEIDMA